MPPPPPRLVQMENRVTTVRYCFLTRGSQREGCIDPDAGISPCANRMGKHAFQAHFDGKYISKNIYARWLTDTDTHRQAHTHTRRQRQYPRPKLALGKMIYCLQIYRTRKLSRYTYTEIQSRIWWSISDSGRCPTLEQIKIGMGRYELKLCVI